MTLLYDIAQQRGKALKTDVIEAQQYADEIGKYLGQLSTNGHNAINKYLELARSSNKICWCNASAATNAVENSSERTV